MYEFYMNWREITTLFKAITHFYSHHSEKLSRVEKSNRRNKVGGGNLRWVLLQFTTFQYAHGQEGKKKAFMLLFQFFQ